jgi:hypothetical protein
VDFGESWGGGDEEEEGEGGEGGMGRKVRMKRMGERVEGGGIRMIDDR